MNTYDGYKGDVKFDLPPGAAQTPPAPRKASGVAPLQTAPQMTKLLQNAGNWRGEKMKDIEVSSFALPDKYRVIQPPVPLRGELSLYFCMNRFRTRAFRDVSLAYDMQRKPQSMCEDLRRRLLDDLRKPGWDGPHFLGGGRSVADVLSRREHARGEQLLQKGTGESLECRKPVCAPMQWRWKPICVFVRVGCFEKLRAL